VGWSRACAYAASKGAVEVLTRYLAVELAGRGIRVNALIGGAIDDTEFLGGMMRSQEVAAHAAQQIALGRIGHVDELAAAVPAILSDSFAWATGSVIDVSGGPGPLSTPVTGPASTSTLQQLPGHDHALDLVGPLVDLGDRGSAGSFRS
jgi:NAD(P)-dependent dehydrogenase (short-subunit alcohol dehydrogenase family)